MMTTTTTHQGDGNMTCRYSGIESLSQKYIDGVAGGFCPEAVRNEHDDGRRVLFIGPTREEIGKAVKGTSICPNDDSGCDGTCGGAYALFCVIRPDDDKDHRERYYAGCRNFTYEEACEHWPEDSGNPRKVLFGEAVRKFHKKLYDPFWETWGHGMVYNEGLIDKYIGPTAAQLSEAGSHEAYRLMVDVPNDLSGVFYTSGCRYLTYDEAVHHWSDPDHQDPIRAKLFLEAIEKDHARRFPAEEVTG